MAINSYDKLVNAVADWMNRTDLTDQMSQFIALTESTATRTLRVPSMERRILTSTENGVVLLPFDYLEAKSLYFLTGSRRFTVERTNFSKVSQIISNSGSTVGGYPQYFARTATQLVLAPLVTDSQNNIELEYYSAIPSLNEEGGIPTQDPDGGNWLLDMAPEVYLYGCLHEACMYVKDNDRAEYWMGKFELAIARLQLMADLAEYSGSELAAYGSSVEAGVY